MPHSSIDTILVVLSDIYGTVGVWPRRLRAPSPPTGRRLLRCFLLLKLYPGKVYVVLVYDNAVCVGCGGLALRRITDSHMRQRQPFKIPRSRYVPRYSSTNTTNINTWC